jgi:hypothetical protein
MPVILGHDAGWGGWGWCLGTERGPWAVGHQAIGGRAWRWSDFRQALGELDELLAAAPRERPELGGPVRVAVETAPAVYRGAGRGRGGNQAATGQGMGQIQGGILLWGTRPGSMLYPWEIEVAEWRAWWGIRGLKDRARYKLAAIKLVGQLGWGARLEDYPDPGPEDDHGPRGDVAEAILLTVGAARHPEAAPKGPQRDPAWRLVT